MRDVVNDSGAVIKSFEFDEYGNLLSSSGTGATSPKTWIGGLSVNDDRADSGMFNMGYRNYAAGVLGRFISRDPIGFSGGLNLYAYPTNPLRYVDPSGLQPVCHDFRQKAKDHLERMKRKSAGALSVEILISDPLDSFTSQWGHAAIAFGDTVFSFGQKGTGVYSKTEYLGIQRGIRDTRGYQMTMSDADVLKALESAYLTEALFPKVDSRLQSQYRHFNQCTTVVGDILNDGGINVSEDGFYLPNDLANQLSKLGARTYLYPQTPPPATPPPTFHPTQLEQGADNFMRGNW